MRGSVSRSIDKLRYKISRVYYIGNLILQFSSSGIISLSIFILTLSSPSNLKYKIKIGAIHSIPFHFKRISQSQSQLLYPILKSSWSLSPFTIGIGIDIDCTILSVQLRRRFSNLPILACRRFSSPFLFRPLMLG